MTRLDALVEENRAARHRVFERVADVRLAASRIGAQIHTGDVPEPKRVELKASALTEAVRIWVATEVALVDASLDGAA